MQTSAHKHTKRSGLALRSLSKRATANGVRGKNLYRDLEKIKTVLARTTGKVRARAQNTLIDSLDDIQDKYASMQKNTANFVSINPFKTIGYSVLAGLVLSFFIRR